ncbi:MAG: LysR substrate-binding domain-containing protein [Sneathiellales bacterium]|nr:LysR substrate-binding domain-containing protein [Sneathiellales bacterium]
MKKNIDTDLLRTFVAIHDHGGFIKAGNGLGRSQSAISMQMKRLEEICETSLFVRVGRKMQFTPQGEKLLSHARKLILMHDQALDSLKQSDVEGIARLGVMGDYATNVLPSIISAFLDEHPNIEVEITTGFTTELIEKLGSDFDLVLATQQIGTTGGEVLKLETTHWAYATNRELPPLKEVPLALLPPGNMFREWALKTLDDAGMGWRIIFTSTSIAAVEAAAEAGIALTVVKQGSKREGLRLLDDLEELPPLPGTEIALHTAPGVISNATKLLKQHLKKQVSDL